MRVHVFDPGTTTGYAFWDTEVSELPVAFGEFSKEQLFEHLNTMNGDPDFFVYENYRVRINPKQKGFNHAFEEVPAARIIGAVELTAHRLKAKIVKQETSALKVGCGYGGIPVPKGHIKDHLSAMAHGFYFLVKRGVIKPIGYSNK